MRRYALSILAAVLGVAGTACRAHGGDAHVPTGPPAPVLRTAVFLQVVDQRPPDRGGLDPRRVGWMQGRYGIPRHANVPANTVSRNVWSATADALAQLGLGAGGGPNKLLATVLEFWNDPGAGNRVAVRYQLIDAHGRERWAVTIESGSNTRGDPATPAVEAPPPPPGSDPAIAQFGTSLAVLAASARAHFAT